MKTLMTMALAIALGTPTLVPAQAPAIQDAGRPAAPRLRHDSAFADYQPYRDVPVADWRRVNDTVREAAAKGAGPSGDGAAAPPAGEARPPAANAEGGVPGKEQDRRRTMHGGHQ